MPEAPFIEKSEPEPNYWRSLEEGKMTSTLKGSGAQPRDGGGTGERSCRREVTGVGVGA